MLWIAAEIGDPDLISFYVSDGGDITQLQTLTCRKCLVVAQEVQSGGVRKVQWQKIQRRRVKCTVCKNSANWQDGADAVESKRYEDERRARGASDERERRD